MPLALARFALAIPPPSALLAEIVSRETFVRGTEPHRALGSALAEQGPRWVPEGALQNGPS